MPQGKSHNKDILEKCDFLACNIFMLYIEKKGGEKVRDMNLFSGESFLRGLNEKKTFWIEEFTSRQFELSGPN